LVHLLLQLLNHCVSALYLLLELLNCLLLSLDGDLHLIKPRSHGVRASFPTLDLLALFLNLGRCQKQQRSQ